GNSTFAPCEREAPRALVAAPHAPHLPHRQTLTASAPSHPPGGAASLRGGDSLTDTLCLSRGWASGRPSPSRWSPTETGCVSVKTLRRPPTPHPVEEGSNISPPQGHGAPVQPHEPPS